MQTGSESRVSGWLKAHLPTGLAGAAFWLALWFMFGAGFKQVGGWRLGDVARLLGIIYTLFGTATVFFGGYRDMAGAILRGEID